MLVAGCNDPGRGQSSAHEIGVGDGQIVLVRRGKEVGAFILRNQQLSPEVTDYTWYYRADGRGALVPADGAVSSGTVTNATTISFRTFSVQWSINSEHRGWVYYSKSGVQPAKKSDFEMCITTETNLANVGDANSRKWKYRNSSKVNFKALLESEIKRK